MAYAEVTISDLTLYFEDDMLVAFDDRDHGTNGIVQHAPLYDSHWATVSRFDILSTREFEQAASDMLRRHGFHSLETISDEIGL